MSKNILNQVFGALDNMSEQEVIDFLKRPENELTHVKIGLEQFYRCGPDLITKIKNEFGKKIFLDLKLHDIPNTVSKAILALENIPFDFLTVHLSGGREMLTQAKSSLQKINPNAKLLGVSYLTSLGETDFEEMWKVVGAKAIEEKFISLFELADSVPIDGIVCSPHELSLFQSDSLKDSKLIKVTPGIRFKSEIISNSADDQKRVLDPLSAINNGASFLVMGRSLNQATDLKAAIGELKNLS